MAQHSFWIIVDGETPTSFRSRQREDLVPTLHQLQRKQPQVKLLWFERGRLWASPTEARESLIARRKMPTGRGRQWRPGGDHVDPRAKYEISRDQKRARFKARLGYDRSQPETPDDRGRDSDPSDAAKPPASSAPPSPPAASPRPYRANRPPSTSSRRPPGGPSSRPSSGRPSSGRPPFDSERRPPARSSERYKSRDERPSPPPAREAAPKSKPKGFGDRPWRPKGPWKPKKPLK